MNALVRYGLAIAVCLAASILRWVLEPVMGPAPPYITLYLAIVAAAALGGFGPGLAATLFGWVMAVLVAQFSNERLALGAPAELVRMAIYFASGVSISVIAGTMHRARRSAQQEAERLRLATEQLRVANEQLEQEHRNKNRFLAMLAHELRNPLQAMSHSLYVLKRGPPTNEELVRRTCSMVERQVAQMTRLVNDLLDISRISRDELVLHRESIHLAAAVKRVTEDHQMLFASKQINLSCRAPEEPVVIEGDASRLSQALGNLLHNALKFTPGGGTTTVTLERTGAVATIRVCDTGPGVDPGLAPRIFEPFVHGGHDSHRGQSGLGLGLALVRRLVELHHGTIELAPPAPNRGAEFVVSLPLPAGGAQEPLGRPDIPAQ